LDNVKELLTTRNMDERAVVNSKDREVSHIRDQEGKEFGSKEGDAMELNVPEEIREVIHRPACNVLALPHEDVDRSYTFYAGF